jgi:hypothetical protein
MRTRSMTSTSSSPGPITNTSPRPKKLYAASARSSATTGTPETSDDTRVEDIFAVR